VYKYIRAIKRGVKEKRKMYTDFPVVFWSPAPLALQVPTYHR